MITERQPIAELWVGADFAMGRNRKGSIAVLSNWVPPVAGTCTWSPADARRSGGEQHRDPTPLVAGAVRGAADLLGRSYRVPGEVEGDA